MISDSTVARHADLDPDVRLMLAVRDGDARAFEQLVARYQGRLVTILRHWLDDPVQIEDLVQEVFLRIYRARQDYTPTARFSTWVFTIAQNVARNARRTLARRREVQIQQQSNDSREVETLDQLAKAASGQMPTRQVAKREMSDIVAAAIRTLNERQRMAVLLCKFEGLSYNDIATAMEISPSAVKSLLTRARENLRVTLRDYLQEGRAVLDSSEATAPSCEEHD